jgi:hypothetical protein
MMAAWALMSLLLLLGISVIDNFLEVGRYTMQVWLIVALWQLDARRPGATAPEPGA